MKNETSKNIPDYQVLKYSNAHKAAWDTFISQAKNATFLFRRDFMEYHTDRFQDFSILIFKDEKLVAVLPANRQADTLHSHQGLSYGGLLLSKKIKFQEVLLIFKTLLSFLTSEGFTTLNLKLLPKIYHSLPADEMEYLLFLTEAKCIRTDVSSAIDLQNPLKIQANRLEGVKKAERNELSIEEDTIFKAFWNEILIPNLKERHQAKPVHTLAEIEALAAKFPKNILQFNVMKGGKIIAGATIFETKLVAHVQYISANSDKQQLGSLDYLFHSLITERFKQKTYFDFGISNTNQGKNINEGLLYWKECFGARSIVHQFYELKTGNFTKLESVFL